MTGPLNGVVVLDLGQYLAGPYAPMLLSDLGAEVIKVEPVRGDSMRHVGMAFIGCQRGKLDIAVDMKTTEGLEVVLRLAELADVVHHNMTKGTATRALASTTSRLRRAIRTSCTATPTRMERKARCRTSAGWTRSTKLPVAWSTRPGPWPRETHPCTSVSAWRTPPTRWCRSSGYLPLCTTNFVQARDRTCGRRCSTARPCSVPTCSSWTESPARPVPDSIATRRASHPVAGSTRPRRGGCRSRRSVRATGRGCVASSGGRSSIGTTRWTRASRPGPTSSRSSSRSFAPGPRWRGITRSQRRGSRRRSRSTATTAKGCFTTPTTSVSAWWRTIPTPSWGKCANSAP